MGERTAISWADATFNPWIGCTKVSPGCDHCYAERDMDIRRKRAKWGPGQERSRTSIEYWRQPLKWDLEAKRTGRHFRVFCASLADVFDNDVPEDWRRDLFDLIEETPNLTWMLLTKRIGLVPAMAYRWCLKGWPDHVWMGATVVNQAEADRDIPKLLSIDYPPRVRWLSIEPQLGPIDLTRLVLIADQDRGYDCLRGHDLFGNGYASGGPRIDWVICGGESGPEARPLRINWVRSLRDQCAAAGAPFHFKQWGEWGPLNELWMPGISGSTPISALDGYSIARYGKKDAGHLLDGVEHRAFPNP